MTSYFHTVRPVDEQIQRCVVCRVAVVVVHVAASQAWAAAAHWLAGLAGRLAGARQPGLGARCPAAGLHAGSELCTEAKFSMVALLLLLIPVCFGNSLFSAIDNHAAVDLVYFITMFCV